MENTEKPAPSLAPSAISAILSHLKLTPSTTAMDPPHLSPISLASEHSEIDNESEKPVRHIIIDDNDDEETPMEQCPPAITCSSQPTNNLLIPTNSDSPNVPTHPRIQPPSPMQENPIQVVIQGEIQGNANPNDPPNPKQNFFLPAPVNDMEPLENLPIHARVRILPDGEVQELAVQEFVAGDVQKNKKPPMIPTNHFRAPPYFRPSHFRPPHFRPPQFRPPQFRPPHFRPPYFRPQIRRKPIISNAIPLNQIRFPMGPPPVVNTPPILTPLYPHTPYAYVNRPP